MGVHLFGKSGASYGLNWWWWRPLAAYCNEVAPAVWAQCNHWECNEEGDGDSLDAAGSLALADALQRELDAGRTENYARRYTSAQEMAPDEPCDLCEGTGVRRPIPYAGAGVLEKGGFKWNGCEGKGHVRPSWTDYPFEAETVVEFVAFLRASGGFDIC